MTTQRMLQICPNDHPPFADICALYERAGESLNLEVQTLYLSAPTPSGTGRNTSQDVGAHHQGRGQTTYLNFERLTQTRQVSRAIADAVDVPVCLAVCHRYRSYKTFVASRVRAARTVAVAHEFGFFARRRRRWERMLIGRDVVFAGVSPAVTDELNAVTGAAAWLPNGIDVVPLQRAMLNRDAARAGLSLPPGAFVVGVVGRLHAKKCPDLALDAFARFRSEVPDAHLVFVGDGALRDSLQRRADEGAPGRGAVTFAGFVADARRYFPAFDALLVPSGDQEAFALVLLEAMVAGVPVVLADSPGPVSVAGDSGYVFSGGDADAAAGALKRVYDEVYRSGAGALDAYRRHALQRVTQQFSVSALARRLDALMVDVRPRFWTGP